MLGKAVMGAADHKKKEISRNTVYTLAGVLALNGVLQLIVYPRLTADLGTEKMGTVLFVMGLVAILCPSIGLSLNNGRLVLRRNLDVSNGDYFQIVFLYTVISMAAVFPFCWKDMGGPAAILPSILLVFLTTYRYYGDVEYRLSLNYKRYFIYYLMISAGYLAGYAIYKVTGSWYWVFLTGEALGLIYLTVTGSVFRQVTKKSPYFKTALEKGTLLVGSYLIMNTALNMDRLILKGMVGGEAVTIYYVTSLIGKTLVLLVAPLNTILISYLTKDKVRLSEKQFLKLSGAGILVSLVFFALCQIGTPIFVRLFYSNLTEQVRPYITIVNMTQILAILSSYLFILVLTFTEEKWQLILQACHLGVLLALAVPMTLNDGLMGFSKGILIANALRIVAVLTLGFVKIRSEEKV